ncbi:hypothetical protein MPRI_10340 [Mycobacterium paraintracellulare]|uniref:Uncharacterized protein n=1 Tax=Mycobacterium paraintracellulare TaxID=1138383 RepID=A0ABN6AM84_9MYCO|nr:hypothetical protein MPRI_10340 [Mycobacterium paraintracellulare]
MAALGRCRDGRRISGRFALSRTVGLFGFSERGWDPSPYAAISVAAEVVILLLWWRGGRLRLSWRQTTSV